MAKKNELPEAYYKVIQWSITEGREQCPEGCSCPCLDDYNDCPRLKK